jgi:hypothetical protein
LRGPFFVAPFSVLFLWSKRQASGGLESPSRETHRGIRAVNRLGDFR